MKKFLLWTLVVLWMGLIFYMSSQTGEESGELSAGIIMTVASIMDPSFDQMSETQKKEVIDKWQHLTRKTAHFTEYAILGILCFVAFLQYNDRIKRKMCVLLSVCIAAVYASTDEIHQRFVDGRGGQISDVIIDSSGALVGALVALGVVALYLKHKSKKENLKSLNA